jgi:hypothetical protein
MSTTRKSKGLLARLFSNSEDEKPAAAERSSLPMNAEQKEIMASIVLNGNIAKLTSDQRVIYVKQVCDRLGIDWSTQPFQILNLNGKERLYATKDATDQLRKVHGVSIYKLDKVFEQDLCIVTAYARDRNSKEDTSTGAVSIKGLQGESLANAIMKAETKAKRRATLSICGLGMLDENEVETIENAQTHPVQPVAKMTIDVTHSEVKPPVKQQQAAPEAQPTKSIEDLHKEFMGLHYEYAQLVGDSIAAPYHPDNWKNERTIKAYVTSIPFMRTKISEAKERKEFANAR